MIITSKITGKTYDSDRVLYINFQPQWSFYFSQGCEDEFLDLIYDRTQNHKYPICMVFKKSLHMKELYDMWQKRKGCSLSDLKKDNLNE